ncbi:MAG: DUF2480 family protein [Cytophagales bacterium]|nr:DUF2480 family protein [Cytophagales bacterium]
MEESEIILNKVAASGLITIDLQEYYSQHERVLFDLKHNLFQGLILKEKDFREFVSVHDWSSYQGKNVAVTCTEDAIIPVWAYMLVISKLTPFANYCTVGTIEDMNVLLFQIALNNFDPTDYKDKKVVIKGCSKYPVPTFAYAELTKKLLPFTSSIMYGEPCSTVPIYKRPK